MKPQGESATFDHQVDEALDKELAALKQLLGESSREWLLIVAVAVLEVLDEKYGTKISLP
jgi:hypothetical protein